MNLRNAQEITAYQAGYQASIDADGEPAKAPAHPYEVDSPEWHAYNHGWNSHYEARWFPAITECPDET